jgi:hypothetical protein
MRKILLASSALVGVAMLAAPAFAGDLTVKLSGYDTAMLGFNDTTGTSVGGAGSGAGSAADDKSNNVGMQNLFDINVSVEGRGSNNLDYGAMISIWDGPSVQNLWGATGTANAAYSNDAYVWLSNNWGKLMLGDAHGASDLFVYAPTVGTNQIDGSYQQFQNLARDWRALPTFIDNNESSTRIPSPSINHLNLRRMRSEKSGRGYKTSWQSLLPNPRLAPQSHEGDVMTTKQTALASLDIMSEGLAQQDGLAERLTRQRSSKSTTVTRAPTPDTPPPAAFEPNSGNNLVPSNGDRNGWRRGKALVQFTIPPDAHIELGVIAKRRRIDVSDIGRAAINLWLEKHSYALRIPDGDISS